MSQFTVNNMQVCAAYGTGFDPDEDLSRADGRRRHISEFERPSRSLEHHGLHVKGNVAQWQWGGNDKIKRSKGQTSFDRDGIITFRQNYNRF